MSYPAYIIAESKVNVFLNTLSQDGNHPFFEFKEEGILELTSNECELRVAISPNIEHPGFFTIKPRSKVPLFGPSKELDDLLKRALANSSAVPIEDFDPNTAPAG